MRAKLQPHIPVHLALQELATNMTLVLFTTNVKISKQPTYTDPAAEQTYPNITDLCVSEPGRNVQ